MAGENENTTFSTDRVMAELMADGMQKREQWQELTFEQIIESVSDAEMMQQYQLRSKSQLQEDNQKNISVDLQRFYMACYINIPVAAMNLILLTEVLNGVRQPLRYPTQREYPTILSYSVLDKSDFSERYVIKRR